MAVVINQPGLELTKKSHEIKFLMAIQFLVLASIIFAYLVVPFLKSNFAMESIAASRESVLK